VKIGILSDTHNNTRNTQAALEIFRQNGITKLIHCGDITTGSMIQLFMGWDVAFVLGNMDLHRDELIAATKYIGVMPPQHSREVEVDGRLIGVTHGHDQNQLYRLIISSKYLYVCHGHTHERRNEFQSAYGVRVINPGALGGNRPQARSVCILDTAADEVQFIEVPAFP
jgi:putative phosphoesterase